MPQSRTDLEKVGKPAPKERLDPLGNAARESPRAVAFDGKQTLFVLKGWKEAQILPAPATTSDPPGDGVSKLLRASIYGNAATAAEEVETAAHRDTIPSPAGEKVPSTSDTPDTTEAHIRATSSGTVASNATIDPAPQLVSLAGAEAVNLPATAPPMRDGIPLVVVNYLAATEFEERKAEEDEASRDGDANAHDFSQQDGDRSKKGSDSEDPEEMHTESEVAPTEFDALPSSTPALPDNDRANDLYWKMAGWL